MLCRGSRMNLFGAKHKCSVTGSLRAPMLYVCNVHTVSGWLLLIDPMQSSVVIRTVLGNFY